MSDVLSIKDSSGSPAVLELTYPEALELYRLLRARSDNDLPIEKIMYRIEQFVYRSGSIEDLEEES